jgi:hypothetical protein
MDRECHKVIAALRRKNDKSPFATRHGRGPGAMSDF